MIARKHISILLLIVILCLSVAFRAIGVYYEDFSSTHAPYPYAYRNTPVDHSKDLRTTCGNGLDLGLDKQCYGCASTSTSASAAGSIMIQGPGNSSGLYCKAADGTLSQPVKSTTF